MELHFEISKIEHGEAERDDGKMCLDVTGYSEELETEMMLENLDPDIAQQIHIGDIITVLIGEPQRRKSEDASPVQVGQ